LGDKTYEIFENNDRPHIQAFLKLNAENSHGTSPWKSQRKTGNFESYSGSLYELAEVWEWNCTIFWHSVIMNQLIGSQRAFALKFYYKNDTSLISASLQFKTSWSCSFHLTVQSRHRLRLWRRVQFSKKKTSWPTQQTPENIKSVQASFSRSPRRFAKHIHQHWTSVERSTFRWIF